MEVGPLQINVIEPKLFQADVNSGRNIGDTGMDFSRHKVAVSRPIGFLNRKAQFFFGSVNLGSVEVVIPQVNSVLGRVHQFTIDFGVL